jgi:hypothetical protein
VTALALVLMLTLHS